MASLPKDEPVMLASSVTALVGYVLTLLVTRGIITDVQASTLSQTLLPFAAAVLPILAGLVARQHVTPTVKAQRQLGDAVAATAAASARPGLTEVDFSRLQAVLDEKLGTRYDVGEHPAIIDPPTGGTA